MTSFNQLSEKIKELHRKVCKFTILRCHQLGANCIVYIRNSAKRPNYVNFKML